MILIVFPDQALMRDPEHREKFKAFLRGYIENGGSALQVNLIDADLLIILTTVEKVALHYGTPQQTALGRVSASQMRAYAAEGHFKAGSMGPKVEAACRFVEHTCGRAVIGALADASRMLRGEAGTAVVQRAAG